MIRNYPSPQASISRFKDRVEEWGENDITQKKEGGGVGKRGVQWDNGKCTNEDSKPLQALN